MYKIIYNNNIIDVVEYPSFVRFLSHGHIALTDKTSAQGIVGSDNETIYSFIPDSGHNFLVVNIVEIKSLEEFKRLQNLLNSSPKLNINDPALEKAKNDKISFLSEQCKNKIISGFSISLSDGKKHSFKFTVEDQLNLMFIENQIRAGERYFVYHSTDDPCRLFTRADMQRIIYAFKQHKLYHTTYFNAAKQYIKSLTDIEAVSSFNYGMDISETITDNYLKNILRTGGTVI